MERRFVPCCRWLLVIVNLMATAPQLFAQAPGSETIQQHNSIPGLLSPANEVPQPSQNLGEIRIVQEYPKPEMFTFAASQEYYYSDNVFFTHLKTRGSGAYQGSYTASIVPYSLRDWTPRLTAQFNMVRYDRLSAGDFDNERIAASSTYVFGQDRHWTWDSAVLFARYTLPHPADHEYYREMIYDNTISRSGLLARDLPLSWVAACNIAYHQTSPDQYDYLSNGLTLGLNYNPIKEVVLTPYLNPSVRNFFTNTATQHDRNDLHLAAGLDIAWQPCPYALATISIYHVNDFSNNSGLSFNYTIPGVSVTGEIQF